MVHGTRQQEPNNVLVEPLRIRVKAAAAMLSLEPVYLYELIRDGVFTAIRPHGKGRGKQVWLVPAEVRAYATGGREAVARLRKNGRRSSQP